jgi:hypothetical protein
MKHVRVLEGNNIWNEYFTVWCNTPERTAGWCTDRVIRITSPPRTVNMSLLICQLNELAAARPLWVFQLPAICPQNRMEWTEPYSRIRTRAPSMNKSKLHALPLSLILYTWWWWWWLNLNLSSYSDDVNVLGDNIGTIKKNMENLIDDSKEVGLK